MFSNATDFDETDLLDKLHSPKSKSKLEKKAGKAKQIKSFYPNSQSSDDCTNNFYPTQVFLIIIFKNILFIFYRIFKDIICIFLNTYIFKYTSTGNFNENQIQLPSQRHPRSGFNHNK